ncbi:hypothetical protein SAMN05421823_103666 [Catalinimonas alkaloidigena]|uniref:YD repeat-containing protein n=1 Tax=Catalinimonas alkaloidigena TaxID=1075417 RepID=A0A1G9F412_9BACT|nr:hypothetical protein [Catalinimonas alkaloidigena]SDK83088.1 hypothetical protein SAMN05421823_103666 [Catalinimonas alkaloidigena]
MKTVGWLLAMFWFVAAHAQSSRLPKYPPDRWDWQLQQYYKGANVKEVHLYRHRYDARGRLDKQSELVWTEVYNKRGNLVERTDYDAGGKAKIKFDYSKRGVPMQCIITDGRGKVQERHLYRNGQLYRIMHYKEDEKRVAMLDEVVYKGDQRELLRRNQLGAPTHVTNSYFDPTGKFYFEKLFTVDEELVYDHRFLLTDEGQIRRMELRRPDENATPLAEYRYNEEGQRIEARYYNDQGVLQTREVLKYDHRKLPTEKITYDAEGKPLMMDTYGYKRY